MDRVTLAGLLELAIWAEVEACLRRHYYPGPDDVEQQADVTAHQRVYEALRELQAEPSDGLLIEITLDAGEPDQVDAYFDAHGVLAKSGERVAMDFQRWETWLGMDIAPATRDTYSAAEVVAHCIHEMTFYGYDQDEIAAAGAEVLRRGEDLKHGRSTTISLGEFRSTLGLDEDTDG